MVLKQKKNKQTTRLHPKTKWLNENLEKSEVIMSRYCSRKCNMNIRLSISRNPTLPPIITFRHSQMLLLQIFSAVAVIVMLNASLY